MSWRSHSSGCRRLPRIAPVFRPCRRRTDPLCSKLRTLPAFASCRSSAGSPHPWGLAFRRNGDILVTERDKGILRVIRDGQLLERSVPGVPEVYTDVRRAGLMDIAIHPDDDSLVYLTYSQAAELDPSEEVPTWAYDGQRGSRVALARGRLDGGALTEVRDLFRDQPHRPRRLRIANRVRTGRAPVYDRRWGDQDRVDRRVCAGSRHSLRKDTASAR